MDGKHWNRRAAKKTRPTQEVPFNLRERQNIARILRRARIGNFVAAVALTILFVCGVFALSVIRLSADPNYIKPW